MVTWLEWRRCTSISEHQQLVIFCQTKQNVVSDFAKFCPEIIKNEFKAFDISNIPPSLNGEEVAVMAIQKKEKKKDISDFDFDINPDPEFQTKIT